MFKLSLGKELREIPKKIDRANRWQENKDLREVKENHKYMETLVGKRREKGKAMLGHIWNHGLSHLHLSLHHCSEPMPKFFGLFYSDLAAWFDYDLYESEYMEE